MHYKSYNFESSCNKKPSTPPLWDCIIPAPRNCLPDPVDFTDKICGDFAGGIFISKGLANSNASTVYLARVQGDLLFSDVKTDFVAKPHHEDPTSKCWIQIPDKDYVDGLHMFTLEKLAEEVERAQTKETELANSIKAESDRAKTAESALRDDLQTEKARAQTKETELANSIKAESDRAKTAESALRDDLQSTQAQLQTEKARAQTKETELANSIKAESDRAKTSQEVLETKLQQVESKVDSHSATIRLLDATGKIVIGFAHATEAK